MTTTHTETAYSLDSADRQRCKNVAFQLEALHTLLEEHDEFHLIAPLVRPIMSDAMAVDTIDPCGIYFGTTGGQVYASNDSGDSWELIVRDLPAVLSVEAQTLS